MNPDPEPLAQVSQQFQEVESIRILAKDPLPFVTPASDVETTSRQFDAQWTCHRRLSQQNSGLLSSLMSTV
jgi:hypothetical protein